jgi:small subunit ribosomal protein S9
MAEEERPPEEPGEEETPSEPVSEEAPETPPDTPPAEEPVPEQPPAAGDEAPAEDQPEAPPEAPAAEAADAPAADAPAADAPAPGEARRDKPAIPGADLEVDIVPEGSDPLGREAAAAEAALPEALVEPEPEPVLEEAVEEEREPEPAPAPRATIDLAADARYTATGKRKSAIARVILKPGKGDYTVNKRPLDTHFPRPTLRRNIRQPLETVGYEARMDVVANLRGGGVAAQADALRHGIARALIEADPNLRAELKRRGFLTRDPRVKERRKAGLKKARKRPQFSKR